MRMSAIVFGLCLACEFLPGCAGNPSGHDFATAHHPSAGHRPNGRSTPAGPACDRRTVCAEMLRKKLASWPAVLGRKISVSALIVDNRALGNRPTSSAPVSERWEDRGPNGHFSATWIGSEGGLWAVVRFRRGGNQPTGLGPLLFVWSGSRWRVAWPTRWTREDRRKFRRFISLGLAGKLPPTANGINELLPRPAKILPMHIKLNIAIAPEVPRAQKDKRKGDAHR